VLPLLLLLAASGGRILEARLEAKVGGGRDVPVRLSYRIEKKVAERVAFSFLEIDGVEIEDLSAVTGEGPLLVELAPRSGPKRVGAIDVPAGESAIELRYVVKGGSQPAGNGLRARLPLAILDLEIEETRNGLFSSAIALPDGFSVVDGFPSHPIAGPEGATHWELPLVPTFVAFRASSGAALLTPPRVATAAVVALLLTVGIVGVRRARTMNA
jgi:hypothetical protein